jgi:hypothetical protein
LTVSSGKPQKAPVAAPVPPDTSSTTLINSTITSLHPASALISLVFRLQLALSSLKLIVILKVVLEMYDNCKVMQLVREEFIWDRSQWEGRVLTPQVPFLSIERTADKNFFPSISFDIYLQDLIFKKIKKTYSFPARLKNKLGNA